MMKKRKVINWMVLPVRSPLMWTLVLYLLVTHMEWGTWVWILYWMFVAVSWIMWLLILATGEVSPLISIMKDETDDVEAKMKELKDKLRTLGFSDSSTKVH